MFRPSFNQRFYFIQKSDFNGDSNEPFLQAATGKVYVLSENGLFLFDKSENQCEKIATAAFVEEKLNLPSVFEDEKLPPIDVCYALNEKEASIMKYRTQIACNLTGLVETSHFERLYRLAKALISHESLLSVLELFGEGVKDSQFILALFASDKTDLTSCVDTRLLTQEQLRMLGSLIDWKVVPEVNATIDMVRLSFIDKTPVEIAAFLKSYCGEFFNDSVLAEKWEKFGDSLLPQAVSRPSFQQNH